MMMLEEPTDQVYRNLDSVKCKVRDNNTDELFTLSYSDLSDYDRARALEPLSNDELLKVVEELTNSFTVDLYIMLATLRGNSDLSRMELVTAINVVADHIRGFGDSVQLGLPNDFDFELTNNDGDVEDDADEKTNV